MTIEKFEKKHIDDAAEIERQCFSSPWSREQLAEELENSCARFLAAVENGRAVGYAGLYVVCGEGDVARVAVLPEYRKSGVARAILQQAFTDDLTAVFLDVRQSNVPAINLYHSLGFTDVGVRKDYYANPTEDAILMKNNTIEINNAMQGRAMLAANKNPIAWEDLCVLPQGESI